MPEFYDDDEELDGEILVLKAYSPQAYYHLSDDDIAKIEKGSNPNSILSYE